MVVLANRRGRPKASLTGIHAGRVLVKTVGSVTSVLFCAAGD
jgi:hypothetical protein